ncbi:MAG: substrate-binding domain-containing protein [Bacteroidota bacterium]|nr:substrate-binding domain-containing protein [Bacteroidota bacterium]
MNIIKAINRTRIKDIAQKANVSIGTVDRVIHNRGEVSNATRDRILRIIDEMEYQPNLMASTLASKKTFSFALLLPEPISPESYWNKPMVGVRRAFQEIQQYGININIHLFKQSDANTFNTEAGKIIDSNPEGVVLAPFFSRESKEFISELKKRAIPYVFIDSNIKDSDKLSYIGQNSFQSGTLAAKLLDFSVPENSSILVLHFAKERDNMNHLVQREKGFYEYFNTNLSSGKKKLITLEISDPTDIACQNQITDQLKSNPEIKGIFVTNSQVYYLARLIEGTNISGIRVIGHDLINENIDFLKKGIVDFLICQRPEEQGYKAIITLFEHLVLKKEVNNENYTSIDIITKENLDYYK